jgi:non-reducing end alpha-L-arabinofuranosidase
VKRSIFYSYYLFSRKWRTVVALLAVVCVIAGAFAVSGTPSLAAGSLPCDIYAAAGTPCVAAHSTVRALFSAYSGRLYQVQRQSDSTMTDIGTLTAGGYANAATQDAFCSGTSCSITVLYDQSGRGNDLTIAGPGGDGGPDVGADAAALPLIVGGHKVYGLYVSAGVGYRNNSTSGVATNGMPEGMYMVTSGTHVNAGCCFDYGNAETNSNNNGNGHMDAINFSTECWFAPCSGSGPWVQADMENGLFAGANGSNTNNSGNNSAFVTALIKNNGQNTYAIKGGNAQSGSLTTWYDGAEPNLGGYAPMHQEGAIILGTGGDNTNVSVGSFFEGVMTAGYPTDAADNAVQANIVSVGYGSNVTATPTATPTMGTMATATPTMGTMATATPLRTTGASCSVHYAITNQWPGGFGASLTITNTGTTAINGWNLQFSFPNGQTITQLWNGTVTQSGSAVTITGLSYNASISTGTMLSSELGFNGAWNGTNSPPTAFTLNGTTCQAA